MTSSAKPRFKIVTGTPPPSRVVERRDKNAEAFDALKTLPMGGAIEHLGTEKGWGAAYLRWSRKHNCRLDCYVSTDNRRIVVKTGGPPKSMRHRPLTDPGPSKSVIGMGRPTSPTSSGPLPPGLSPDQVNPNAKPHQGKKLRAQPI